MNRFEIYRLEFTYGDCTDSRPVVVVSPEWYIGDASRDDILVAPISGQMDMYDGHRHFLIHETHPDFAQTGLRKTCYVAADHITFVSRGTLAEPVAELEGSLRQGLADFLARFFG